MSLTLRRASRSTPQIDLTIAIASCTQRAFTFMPRIIWQLQSQINALSEYDQKRVEILMIADNKTQVLGEKRTQLVKLAKGRYVVQVDDDDRLETNFIEELLLATKSDADVLTYLVSVIMNGNQPMLCRYHIGYDGDKNLPTEYQRWPCCRMAVKRSIAVQVPFPSVSFGEDTKWAKGIHPKLRKEHHINKVLYHYDYDVNTTEAQGKNLKK